MNHLPASIEEHLRQAGLSDMEVLLLRHMLDGGAFSVRELASKIGKSTGALDQAMKKLLKKKIVTKELVNKAPKYRLQGTDALGKFLQTHTAKAVKELKRREKDFDTFIASIDIGNTRPDIEYFDGEEGIKQAYTKLLDYAVDGEILQYFPIRFREDEDPLRAFRVEHFRERRKRGIFLRVLTHDTPLGKRFVSRDAFEYRKTLFVSPKRCPLEFEQIICGDTFTCIDYDEDRACIIRFPKLAASERKFFEGAWEEALEGNIQKETEHRDVEVPVITKVFSNIRELFLGKTGIAILLFFAVLSCICTFFLHTYIKSIQTERLKEKALGIATTAALQFSSDQVEKLQSLEDVYTENYRTVVNGLRAIQEQNSKIMFTYILRPTIQKNVFEFVAASDGLDPFNPIDANQDNKLTDEDEIVYPGIMYDVSKMDALDTWPLEKATANKNIYTDQWGTFLTAYAPIFDQNGKVQSVLAVDIDGQEITKLSFNKYVLSLIFIIIFLFLCCIRFAALNRNLLKEFYCLLISFAFSPEIRLK